MAKKKQKPKLKQKTKQKQLTARQQKQQKRKQQQKQKRQQSAQARQAEKQRLFEKYRQAQQVEQKKPQRRGKSANRQELEKRFKKLVDDANSVLSKFDENGRMYIFDDDYGAIFSDKTIMTQKGTFRKNASELTIKELQQRISMFDSFITDSTEYEKDAESFENFADNIGIPRDIWDKDFWQFVDFAKSIIGDRPDFSEIIEMVMAVAEKRFSRGETLDEIKNTFYNAWVHQANVDEFITSFSENGVLL